MLLDTHVALAYVERRTGKLPAAMAEAVENPINSVWVSVVAVWEVAIKSRLGKLPLAVDIELFPEVLRRMGFGLLPVYSHHVLAKVIPVPDHKDPFDRLYLGICAADGMRLVTRDRALIDHPLAWRPFLS